MLKRYVAELPASGERRVVFLDELPWLASPSLNSSRMK
jgi:hypothetical protein